MVDFVSNPVSTTARTPWQASVTPGAAAYATIANRTGESGVLSLLIANPQITRFRVTLDGGTPVVLADLAANADKPISLAYASSILLEAGNFGTSNVNPCVAVGAHT